MKITFAGHSVISLSEKVKDIVKKQMRNSIIGGDTVICYLGGCGDFDNICAVACRELKKEFLQIEMVYVTPYINNLSEHAKNEERQIKGLYDSSIYPPLEGVPPKFAIIRRNEWMVENSDLVIAYIKHNYGGAYRSLQCAKRKNKKIINIADIIQQ